MMDAVKKIWEMFRVCFSILPYTTLFPNNWDKLRIVQKYINMKITPFHVIILEIKPNLELLKKATNLPVFILVI